MAFSNEILQASSVHPTFEISSHIHAPCHLLIVFVPSVDVIKNHRKIAIY